ncbi:Rho guanine nucleotide exchange factor 4 [Entophlyctis luteolus]|nr:Rho guanine nucleotide exchange factor 4 [Entophlyctis luteolus]
MSTISASAHVHPSDVLHYEIAEKPDDPNTPIAQPRTESQQRVFELAMTWSAAVLGEYADAEGKKLSNEDCQKQLEAFRAGARACRIMNAVLPNAILPIADASTACEVSAIQNLGYFARALAAFGIPTRQIFRPLDFFQGNPKGDEAFLRNILHLSILAHERGFRSPEWYNVGDSRDVLQAIQPKFLETPTSSQLTEDTESKLQLILDRLGDIDESVQICITNAVIGMNKAQSENVTLANELNKCLQIISGRLTTIEATQRKIMLALSEAARAHMRRSQLSEEYIFPRTESPPPIPNSPRERGSEASSPQVFKKLPTEILNAGLAKQELLRLSVIYEIIETESDYIRDLGIMANVHKNEFRKKGIDENTISAIFANVEEIFEANQELLSRLDSKKAADLFIDRVGEVFLNFQNDWVKIYIKYCSNYTAATKCIQKLCADPEFKQLLQDLTAKPEIRGLSLESFLIKPVQRICKYPLFLRELIKQTPKTSVDFVDLEKALECMESLTSKVDEHSKAIEKKERLAKLLNMIESSVPLTGYAEKKLILDGVCHMNKSKDRHLILFKESLIISKVVSKSKYVLETVYPMHELVLLKSPIGEINSRTTRTINLQHTIDKREITFLFADEVHGKWLEAFKSSINDPENVLKRQAEHNSPTAALCESPVSSMRERGKSNSSLAVKAPLSRQPTLRGKSLSSFASIHSIIVTEPTACMVRDIEAPEMVDIDGEIWKKAFSAKNEVYYLSVPIL